ncbi:MAG: BamA/TamA family outer membrane protein [Cellvibrio sp.]
MLLFSFSDGLPKFLTVKRAGHFIVTSALIIFIHVAYAQERAPEAAAPSETVSARATPTAAESTSTENTPTEASATQTPLAVATPDCTSFNVDPHDIARDKTSRLENSAFETLDGKTIRNIRFDQIDVFNENDPDENNRIYRFLNKLHVTTREKVIASQLLFKTGDKVNHKTLEETARNLRTRKYLSNAHVIPERVCGDDVDVVVITQDSWALEPQVSYSHKSDSNETGFAISDGNVLGTGSSFKVGYEENALRNLVSYDFSNPYFLNKPISLRALYQDTSDGSNVLFTLERPFYSLDTPRGMGLQYSDLSQVEEIRSRDEVVNSYRHRVIDNELYYGIATDINPNFTQRWVVGVTHEEDSFFVNEDTLQPIPMRDKAVYPWIEYQYLQNQYGVFKNLNQIQRPEDVTTGHTVKARIGFAGTAFGNPDDVLRYKITYGNIIDKSDIHILEVEAELDGRQHLGIDSLDPNVLKSSVAYHYLMNEKHRWYVRAELGVGEHLPQHKELTVGDITGLRGYPTDYLRGNKRYVVSIERRYFSDVHIFNLMRVGGVIFVDAGKAWGLRHEPDNPVLSNVGIGLRLSSTKIRIGNIVHVDVAVPTAAKQGLSKYQLTIGAFQKF